MVPLLLYLQSADDGRLGDVRLLRDANVQFGAPGLAICIPTGLLTRSPTATRSVADISAGDAAAAMMHDGIAGIEAAMKEVVRSQLKRGVTGIGTVANSLGVSPRTLQRTLAEYELTFSELLQQTRMETARELLARTDMSHRDISTELGYRHSTHFTRAFRHACGMTPRQYRTWGYG